MLDDKKKAVTGRTVIEVNNQVLLDANNPIPINFNGNSFLTVRNKKYIPFIGDDNFPALLLEARLISVTQNSCIQDIAAAAIGNGITVINQEKPDPELLNWMKSVNNERESFDDIMLGAVDGERGMGTQFIEIIKGELLGKPFMKIHLHSLLRCRFGVEDPKTGQSTTVLVSKLFEKKGNVLAGVLKDAIEIPLWSPNPIDKDKCWKKDEQGNYRTMLVFKNKVSGIPHYGLPASISGLRSQVLEGKGEQYNIDNFDNNMILGGMLMFKSAMTEEEAQKNAKRIILSHTGEGKTGRIAVVSSESGLEDVKFEKYETSKDGSFIELDKRLEQKIIKANGWNAAFFGAPSGSSLGNGSEYIRNAWDVAEAKLLNPLRRKLLDKVVVPIMQIYSEVYKKKEVAGYDFWFNSAKPFSFLGDLNPEDFMKVNEARDLAGLPIDESKNDVYLSEMKAKQNVQSKSAVKEGANNN